MDLSERAATWVRFDPVRGHITINGDEGPALVTLVDTGSQLELWSHVGAHISPQVAGELADALLAWAAKKERHVA